MSETLIRVTAPHFCAGIVIKGDRCTDAAPILGWCVGKNQAKLAAYFVRKGWKVEEVNHDDH